jgi:hypothetical protein
MKPRLALVLVLAAVLGACSAMPAAGLLADDAIRGLSGAGFTCDGGANTSHSDTVVWTCTRDVDTGTAQVEVLSAGTDVREVTFVVPRGAGLVAARAVLAAAVTGSGVARGVEGQLLPWLNAWEGGTASGSWGTTQAEIEASADVVRMVVTLDRS